VSGTFEAERLARKAVYAAADTDSLWARADTLIDLAEILERDGHVVEIRKVIEEALRTYEQKEHLVGVELATALLVDNRQELASLPGEPGRVRGRATFENSEPSVTSHPAGSAKGVKTTLT
jgi:hypothetical protein